MKTWSLKRTVQCAKCPWKKSTNPHDIPRGYDVEKHRALEKTIAKPDDFSFLTSDSMQIMACHEEHEAHCIGWLMNQLGPGNNIALRISMMGCDNMKAVRLCGAQHATFEETLPEHAPQ